MSATMHDPVVVGIDGTAEAMAAAHYAAWEAERRGVGLRLVFAFRPTPMWGPATLITDDYVWEQPWVRDLLSETVKEITNAHPDLPVHAVAISGSPAGALVTESHRASLVVVGTRATTGLRGHLAGSVAAQVATYANGPVLVIRPIAPEVVDQENFATRPVVVGIDGSTESFRAMAAAVDEAVARGTSLRAVFVWNTDQLFEMGARATDTVDYEEDQAKAERLLDEATVGWTDQHPDLEITRECVRDDDVVNRLCAAAVDGGLIVVGSRGRGGFLGLRLGSTVDALVRQASVPVLVVHRDRDRP